MRVDPSVCGSAETAVGLSDEPLRGSIGGGDRQVGEDDRLVMSACESSGDPDDATAQCDATGACGSLSFAWSCEVTFHTPPPVDSDATTAPPPSPPPLACTGVETPALSSCSWVLPPRSLYSDTNYTFALTVSKPSGESVRSSVSVEVRGGTLPSVSIGSLAALKQNPSRKLALRGSVAVPGLTSTSELSYLWSISPADSDLTSPNSSSTGAQRSSLVLLPNALRAGAVYTVQLLATYRGRAASASVTVIMNRPPVSDLSPTLLLFPLLDQFRFIPPLTHL